MARTNPWRRDLTSPLNVLQNELNKLVEDYWPVGRFGPAPTMPVDLEPSSWSPAIDMTETPDEIILWAELPGVDPASIDLSVTGNVLSLRGEKKADTPPPEGTGTHERQFGPFHREIPLAGEVNFDAAHAESRHGVLKVRLPKKETARPHTIRVQPA